MKWIRYDIKTKTDASDIITAELYDLGITSVEVTDNILPERETLGGYVVDIQPENYMSELGDDAIISFYLSEDDENKRELLEQVARKLEEVRSYMDIGAGDITTSETEDQDWINNWKKYWHSFKINDLIIKPTWENEEDIKKHLNMSSDESLAGYKMLDMDPGTAFGTGSHETTRMVIKQLQKYVKDGDEVLDVGCGSGILSVVALKYGAKHAFGTDLDPNAIIASEENAEQNNIDKKQLEVIEGNIIDDKAVKDACGYECYDIVCANILADVLEPLSTCIHEHMKHGAYFITSGIIDTKENEVAEAFKKNPELEIVEINHDGEWVNITARRK